MSPGVIRMSLFLVKMRPAQWEATPTGQLTYF